MYKGHKGRLSRSCDQEKEFQFLQKLFQNN